MTNKIENQEDLPKNISPQELQKTIAEDKISALNTKISELAKAGESENSSDIYPNSQNNIENRNILTSELEAHKAEIELSNITKNDNHEKQIGHQNFQTTNLFESDWFATPEQVIQIKLQADIRREKWNDKVQSMIDWIVSDFVPDAIIKLTQKRFT